MKYLKDVLETVVDKSRSGIEEVHMYIYEGGEKERVYYPLSVNIVNNQCEEGSSSYDKDYAIIVTDKPSHVQAYALIGMLVPSKDDYHEYGNVYVDTGNKYGCLAEIRGIYLRQGILKVCLQYNFTAEYWKTHVPRIGGHTFVDAGCSVLWSTCNFGADDSSSKGDQLTLEEYRELAAGKCKYYKMWRGGWRLPTLWEFKELVIGKEWSLELNETSKFFNNLVRYDNGYDKIYLPDWRIWAGTDGKYYEEPSINLSDVRHTGVKGRSYWFEYALKDSACCVRPVIDRRVVMEKFCGGYDVRGEKIQRLERAARIIEDDGVTVDDRALENAKNVIESIPLSLLRKYNFTISDKGEIIALKNVGFLAQTIFRGDNIVIMEDSHRPNCIKEERRFDINEAYICYEE